MIFFLQNFAKFQNFNQISGFWPKFRILNTIGKFIILAKVYNLWGVGGGWECISAPPKLRILGNPSSTPEIFSETQDISQGRSLREILGEEGLNFPIPPEFWWSTDILSSSNFLQGVDQIILPCGQGKIDSVTISPSQLLMRECVEIKNSEIENGTFRIFRICFF